jgi:putative ABC transport system ATP-binding protein
MTPLIHLQNIARSYKSGEVEVIAVRNVTRDINRGEFVAIMGSSGSGKSTLMNMLGCLDQATSGDYFLDGINISELDRKQLAMLRNKKLGFVFQSFNLLARTSAIENVELPMLYTIPAISKHERRSRAIQALEKVGLGERLNHHPRSFCAFIRHGNADAAHFSAAGCDHRF